MAAALDCVVEVMAAEADVVDREDVIVTTGGQQVIDLVCKTLIDPGDVIVAEAPTYPGAVPTFCAYEASVVQIEMDGDGMPIDELERDARPARARGAPAEVHLHDPQLPEPRRRDDVAARAAGGSSRSRASASCSCSRTTPTDCCATRASRCRRSYSLDACRLGAAGASDFVIYLGTFSKILSPGVRLGWAVAPRPVLEKLNLGKQGADLCSSSVTQLFVARTSQSARRAGARLARATSRAQRELYRRRRDVMLEALAEHFGEAARWTTPQGGLFIWATLPDYIDTTDLLARAQSESVAFVPGRAAYVDGRGGSSSMRLNFAGSSERRTSARASAGSADRSASRSPVRRAHGRAGGATQRATHAPRRTTLGEPGGSEERGAHAAAPRRRGRAAAPAQAPPARRRSRR